MNYINMVVDYINSILWGKNILVYMLIGAALYFSFKTRFMQFRLFGKIIKVLFKGNKKENGVSSLETFFLGTACRVGAGNIAGVVAAVSVGGAGAVFWMWLVAIFGSATAFVEASLAVIYRRKNENGEKIGGTPFIIEDRLNMRWLGIVYALASIVCYLGVIQIMSNSITGSVTSVYTYSYMNIGLDKIVSVVIAIVVSIILLNRTKRDSIIVTLNKVVPVMAVSYIILVIYILVINITEIPAMISNIFYQAFGGEQIFGGLFGVAVMNGVRRGLFSNEAGSGNSNYAAAAVAEESPAKQGMVQVFGVFIDTLVICSATAFIILLAPANLIKDLSGMDLFQAAISHHIGSVGAPFVMTLMFFFCLTTILAVVFYGKSAIYYITSHKSLNIIFQILVIVMIYVGGIKQNLFVWSLADFGLGIMTVINITCIIFIAKPALDNLKKYEEKLK